MGRMLTDTRRRKAENARRIGILVRQATRGKPVEHTIKRHPVDQRRAKRLLDLMMRQRCWGCLQESQDPHSRRRRTGTDAANQLAGRVGRIV